MKYAVITVDASTKRIIKSALYKEAEDGEIEVDSLPSGNITDYLYENGKYVYSPETPEDPIEIKQLKEYKVSQSKAELRNYLASHPLQWIDGEYYSVTEEKQSLLTSNLAAYQISVSMGSPIDLTWNTTGDRCKSWTYENLAALSLAIVKYVKPFVSHQQDLEIQINNCTTKKEIEDIEIKYE